MQINTNYNYQSTNKRFETVKGKSLTIPDETYTLKELYAKHTRGILPEGLERQEHWSEDASHNDPDLEKLNRMDITDKHLIQKEQSDYLNLSKAKIEQKLSEAKTKKEQSDEVLTEKTKIVSTGNNEATAQSTLETQTNNKK